MTEQITTLNPIDDFRWTENFAPPCEVSEFQREINKIFGTTNGAPNIKIVWGCAEKEFVCERYLMKFESYRFRKPVELRYFDFETGQWIIKPWHLAGFSPTSAPNMFTWEEDSIGTPRWFFMQRHPDRELLDWEERRWEWDDELMRMVDVLGPRPEHFYSELLNGGDLIAVHNERCCNGKGVKQCKRGLERCYGLYRAPDRVDLTRLERALYFRQQERQERELGEAPTQAEMSRAARKSWEAQFKDKRDREQRFTEAIKSGLQPMAHRLTTDDPSVISHGAYHFVRGLKEEPPAPTIITET